VQIAGPDAGEWHHLSATASLIPLEEGLYAVEIGEIAGMPGQSRGLPLPVVQVSAPPGSGERSVEVFGASGRRENWLGEEGATVVVMVPASGGNVLVTTYAAAAQPAAVPKIGIRRLDRRRSNGAALAADGRAEAPEQVRTEIVLHIERLGDQRFPGQGWVGNRGKKLRIEAFSIRPLERLAARDIEFKALGPNRRETPWVSDAKLCGTRGQGMPLTGFAMRLAPHVAGRFDIVYSGAFFDSGVVGPCRNGELCLAPIGDDPLEAITVELIRRTAE
jgi:hypothetical protein